MKKIGTLYPTIGEIDINGKKVTKSVLHMTMEWAEIKNEKEETTHSIDPIIGGGMRVYNCKNHRTFVLSLHEILELAQKAGIDDATPIYNPAEARDNPTKNNGGE